jgi:hypothetical protein
MRTHEVSPIESLSAATEYPVGLTLDVTFNAFAARLTTLPNSELRFEIAEGPYAHTETVKIVSTMIRPGVFLVSWVEAGGATVVHVEDFGRLFLYSYATLPDGRFLRMAAPLKVVNTRASK